MFPAFLDSPQEIIILVVVMVVLFGGSQIPKLAKNLGKAQTEFKRGLDQGKVEGAASTEETIEEKLARLDKIDKASDNPS
ncbi:MAG: twin-arginine translocase TatA/TatE family subunit [Ilumatobacteraceae bacterium]